MGLVAFNNYFFLFVVLIGGIDGKIIIKELMGSIDETITAKVSSNEQVVVAFNLSSQIPVLGDRTLTFEFSSDEARNDRPIVISITSGATVQQVTLPQTVQSASVLYSRTTVTLCLVNSTLDESTTVIVGVTASSSPFLMSFNMTAHLLSNYTLVMGKAYPAVTVAPAAPVSYRFEFPPNVDSVLIHVQSPDERCSVLSVQRDVCPINNREDDVRFQGTYQTFTKQAAITVHRNLFDTHDFFIVVVVLSSDKDCTPTLPMIAWHISNMRHDYNSDPPDLMPIVHSMPRQKTITISLESTASENDIVTAVAVSLAIFVAVFVVILTLLFTVTRKRLTMMVVEKDNLCQALISPDEERQELIRRHRLNPQASSTPSGTLRNHSTYGAVLITEASNVTSRTLVEGSTAQYVSAIAETPEQEATREEISPIGTSSSGDGGVGANNASPDRQKNNSDQADTVSIDSSDYDKVPEVTYDKELIRTKPHLYVSDLSTKRPRDLVKKYALYPWNLGIISFFYVLPVVQLVLAYQIAVIHLGNQDSCYYNFRCAVPFLGFSAFNNIFSNAAYVFLGILLIIIVRYHDHLLRDWEYRGYNNVNNGYSALVPDITPTSPLVQVYPSTTLSIHQNNINLGIPPIYGISYALGIGLIMEGIMSACYHVCPNSSNFQFDTTYMYILSWLLIAKIYQSRHPDIGRNAHLFYFGVAVVVCLAMLGAVFGVNSIFFYVLLCIVMVPMTFDISLYFYFMGSFKTDVTVFYRVYYALRHMVASRSFRPSHPFRLVFVAVFNGLNWGLAIFGVITHPPDFDTFLLTISISNVMLYTVYYVVMKVRHRERLHPLTILLIAIATACWVSALVFFAQHQTSWQLTPAGSRVLNQECLLLNFYDAHDIWHFLSAFSLFSSFLVLVVIDDEIMLSPRNKIHVF